MATVARELPSPLVRLTWRTPHKWAWNKLQLLAWAVVLAYVGMLIMAGLYYVITQLDPDMKELWHTLVSNDHLRHNIRDVGEGFLGGLLAQQVIWNHYRKRRALTRLDRLEMRLHIANLKDDKQLSFWQLLASPFLAVLYAIPGFFIAWGIALLIRHNVVPVQDATMLLQQAMEPHAPTLWSRIEFVVTDNWDKKLMGLGAAFFWGRRPVKGVFDDLQLWVVEMLLRHGKPIHKVLPPTFKARYNDVARHGVPAAERHGFWWSGFLWALAIISLGLAVFGGYVLMFIAAG
jgi:hypothetical protein